MATPPTFVSESEVSSWDVGTTPKTVVMSSAVGDVIVYAGATEDFALVLGTPTANSMTFTARGSAGALSRGSVKLFTAPGNAGSGFTVSDAVTGSGVGTHKWGYNMLRFSGSDGVGAAPAGAVGASGAGTIAITTTVDNSAVVVVLVDWSATAQPSRTWATVNGFTPTAANGKEVTYFNNTSDYTVYVAYYPDVGAAGVKTVGITQSLGGHSKACVEILGSAAAPPAGFEGWGVPV